MATPKGSDSRVQWTIEAGMAAARASGLCQVRKIRSTTYIRVTDPELMTRGRATETSSPRLPGAWRLRRFASAGWVESLAT
jgi:hypothetical protein